MTRRSRIVLPHHEYKKLVDAVMERDGWKCRCCKRRNNLHGHHIVFRSHGGDDASWNLITLCMDCHDAVHMKHCTSRGYIIIMAHTKNIDDEVNADVGVYIVCMNGWTPLAKVRR